MIVLVSWHDVHMTRGCSVGECSRPHKGHGMCKLHLQRMWRQGDPLKVGVPRAPGREAHHNWAGANLTYGGAHLRVRRERGNAKMHDCAAGCGRKAGQWAYNYSDPSPLVDPRGCPYSPDASRYRPLCGSCHKLSDLAQASA